VTILLDTHAFLWFFLGDSRLSTTARSAIESAANQNVLSIASLWEIAIKVSLAKITFAGDFQSVIYQALADTSATVLPITVPHLLEVSRLPFQHRDPFDRLIAAQARMDNLSIVTADEVFAEYNVDRIW
jgi:PIN domain nuclease of toxin-antitoxin system